MNVAKSSRPLAGALLQRTRVQVTQSTSLFRFRSPFRVHFRPIPVPVPLSRSRFPEYGSVSICTAAN